MPKSKAPPVPKLPDPPVPPEAVAEFAARIGLRFNDDFILRRALTHRSYLNEVGMAVEDNERLEFLGDAVLDFVVARWLYNRYPEMKEGWMTRVRSSLVGTQQLADIARELGVGQAIFIGRGEEENGGRERSTLLCDAFEAIIGALCVDVGLDAVEAFIIPKLQPLAESIVRHQSDKDPKSKLQEHTQAQGWGVPQYKQVGVRGPDHERIYEYSVSLGDRLLGVGEGSSKQEASKSAAREALKKLSAD
jgi:ribonuclease-3